MCICHHALQIFCIFCLLVLFFKGDIVEVVEDELRIVVFFVKNFYSLQFLVCLFFILALLFFIERHLVNSGIYTAAVINVFFAKSN